MISAFKALSGREQVLICLAAVILTGALIWQVLWSPIQAGRAAQAAEIARLDALIHVASQVRAGPEDSAPNLTPPSQRITQSAAAAGLTLTRLEPEGQLFRVTLSELQFDAAMAWIAELHADHGLKASEVDMARRAAPGEVTMTLALEPLR